MTLKQLVPNARHDVLKAYVKSNPSIVASIDGIEKLGALRFEHKVLKDLYIKWLNRAINRNKLNAVTEYVEERLRKPFPTSEVVRLANTHPVPSIRLFNAKDVRLMRIFIGCAITLCK